MENKLNSRQDRLFRLKRAIEIRKAGKIPVLMGFIIAPDYTADKELYLFKGVHYTKEGLSNEIAKYESIYNTPHVIMIMSDSRRKKLANDSES